MSASNKSLVFVSEDLVFNLSNENVSYIFRVSPEGILEHIHFGGAIAPTHGLAAGPRREFRCTVLEFQGIKNYSLDDTPQEYPLFGTSDTRQPALHVVNSDGNSTNTFLYKSHEVVLDKPLLNGLPSARGNTRDNTLGNKGGDQKSSDSETLLLTLVDQTSELEVTLRYTIYADHDVIARSATIRNCGSKEVLLHNALSSSLDLPQSEYELVHLRGSWSREFEQERMDVPHGRFVIDSTRGTSSNAHNPFLAVLSRGADERKGDVYGTALMYSGNFAISVEKNEFESVRVSAGINPFNFQWRLQPGEEFVTPESLQVFSSEGLSGMSHVWHGFVNGMISPPQFDGVPRPTYLNSWEAAYFDVSHDVVLGLADKAKSLGVEMLVLDDGWFAGRDDDTSSLGDWFSDPKKFPNGVEETARLVKQKGLKFGLWFEPEMVNKESQLYRDHPDWLIHVPNRTLSTGRYQHTLDLSRTEVVDYLYARLDSFLSSGLIDYVKWDMNRVMTEVGSAGLPAERQLEVPHRYMLGLYNLVERITTTHPSVLFENCASGGNRFDLGMLRYMSQGWVSDMCDPIGRLSIINGASLLFPLSTLASYIGPVPNHQNGRQTSVKMRTEVGFFASARGLSLNEEDLNASEDEIKDAIKLYKASAQDMVDGDFSRIKYQDNEVCWQLISKDGRRVYVGYYHILSAPNLPYRRAKLVGLDSSAQYKLEHGNQVFGGDALMTLGIDLPYVDAMQHQDDTDYTNHLEKGDFTSRLIVLERT